MGLQQRDGLGWAGLWYSLLEIHYCLIWHNVHSQRWFTSSKPPSHGHASGFHGVTSAALSGSKKFHRWHLMWKCLTQELPCSSLPPVDSKGLWRKCSHCTSYCTRQSAACDGSFFFFFLNMKYLLAFNFVKLLDVDGGENWCFSPWSIRNISDDHFLNDSRIHDKEK